MFFLYPCMTSYHNFPPTPPVGVVGVIVVEFKTTYAISDITTKVVSSNPFDGEVYSIQNYVIKFSVTCDRSDVFSWYSGFLH